MTMTQDPQTETARQLVAVQQRIGALADGQASLGEIWASLNTVYLKAQEANDQETLGAVPAIWERAEQLANTSAAAITVAGGALEIAGAVALQRDEAAKAYKELHKAAVDGDGKHPVIGQLIEAVEEHVHEFMEEMEAIHYQDSPEDDMQVAHENVSGELEKIGVSQKAAIRFANWTLYCTLIEVTPEQGKALAAAIEVLFGGTHPEWEDELDDE